MSTQTARKPTLYEQLEDLPEGLRGEKIFNGQLRAQPHPAWPHALASSRLGSDIEAPYGRGGPGGWWIIDEPEIHFEGISIRLADLRA